MQFAFCLEMLFKEMPFIDRLAFAKKAGINNFEFWDWRDKDLGLIAEAMREHKMCITNLSGNRLYGMIDPSERMPFLNEVAETAHVARTVGCPRLMLLVQALRPDGSAVPISSGLSRTRIIDEVVDCGLALAKLGDNLHLDFVIEPLNTIEDHPGYQLDSSGMAFEIIREIHHPRVNLLYDIYHMAVMGENILGDIEKQIDLIGYFHVADAPGRAEPGSGNINYREISMLLHKLDYQGLVGFEYSPTNGRSRESIHRALGAFQE